MSSTATAASTVVDDVIQESTTTPTTMSATVPPHIAAATVAKFEAINERADHKGLAGRWHITCSQPYEITRPAFGGAGGPRYRQTVVDVTVTGQAPAFEGWAFAATIVELNGQFILRSYQGAPPVDRDALVPGRCEHCGTRRRRTDTYVFVHADGTQRQVGSTCLKDFAGWSGVIGFDAAQGEGADEDDWLGVCEAGEEMWPLNQVLQVAICATEALGFMPTSSLDELPTRDVVAAVLTGFPTDIAEAYRPLLADHTPGMTVEQVRGYLADQEASGHGDYMLNLRAIVAADIAGRRELGIVCSAPNAYRRHLAEVAERDSRAPVVDELFAAEKTKITDVPVTVTYTATSIVVYRGRQVTRCYTQMITDCGHRLSWATTSGGFHPRRGQRYLISGTVKGPDVNTRGQLFTQLLRVKATALRD